MKPMLPIFHYSKMCIVITNKFIYCLPRYEVIISCI